MVMDQAYRFRGTVINSSVISRAEHQLSILNRDGKSKYILYFSGSINSCVKKKYFGKSKSTDSAFYFSESNLTSY